MENNNDERYYIVRADRAGVFFGKIARRDGGEVEMLDVRRIWYWSGACSLSQMAVEGVKKPAACNFSIAVPSMTILGAIEIIPCSGDATKNLKAVPVWKV